MHVTVIPFSLAMLALPVAWTALMSAMNTPELLLPLPPASPPIPMMEILPEPVVISVLPEPTSNRP